MSRNNEAREETINPKRSSNWPVWVFPVVFLLLSAAGYSLAALVLERGLAHETLRAIGEALFVAAVLAPTGDFYLRKRLAEDSIQKGVRTVVAEEFGFLNSDQPDALQIAVKAFGASRVYYNHLRWAITFNWEDAERRVVCIQLALRINGHNLHTEGYLPATREWVLESIPPFQTAYLRYSLQCPDSHIDLDVADRKLTRYCSSDHGKLVLDSSSVFRDELHESQRIGYNQAFNRAAEASMHQRSNGFLPLVISIFAITYEIEILGDAVDDLIIAVFMPNSDNELDWRFSDGHGSQHGPHQWRNVTPGQAAILSWNPPT